MTASVIFGLGWPWKVSLRCRRGRRERRKGPSVGLYLFLRGGEQIGLQDLCQRVFIKGYGEKRGPRGGAGETRTFLARKES